MVFKHSTSFSLVFLSAATALLLAAGNASASGTIAQLCAHTDYPSICKSVVKVRGSPATATSEAIHALILKTTHAKSLATKLGAKDSVSGADFNTCTEVYDDAISNLITSRKNLKSGDKAGMNINLSAALTDFVTCDDTFAESPGARSPLGNMNKLLREMASNCLALASEIRRH